MPPDDDETGRPTRLKWLAAAFACLAALLIIVTYLSRPEGPSFPTAPVSGEVTLGGKPLAGASVTFLPKAGASADLRPAVAVTDAAGAFEMRTPAGGGGVASGGVQPGEYLVTVTKPVPPNGQTEEAYQKAIDAQFAQQEKSGREPAARIPDRVELVPRDYSDAQRTKLTAVVKEGDPMTLKISIP